MQYEYTKCYCAEESEASMLNQMGKLGWQLCAVYGMAYYFKKESSPKLNLMDLAHNLDNALEKETPESLKKWLDEKRKS